MTKITVLIVDDDESICMLLKAFLESEGLKAITCHDGQSAVDLLETMPIDIILLDVMMPEMDGFETLRRIRARHSVPVIFLTARDMLTDKEKGFEAGADDYIVKPFDPREVLLRIRAQLRETGKVTSRTVTVGELSIDMDRYRVYVGGEQITGLKPKEIQLLHFLAKNAGQVLTREQIINNVWGYSTLVDSRTIDVHILRLRKALGEYSNYIGTVFGVGYRLEGKK